MFEHSSEKQLISHQRTNCSRRRQCGFNLVEMLITLAVAAALAWGAVPNINSTMQRQQLSGVASEWLSAVALARSEAIARGQRVTIAPRRNGDWISGLTVFVDQNSNGLVDESDVVVRELSALPEGMQVEPHFGAYHGRYLSFNAQGQVRRPTSDGLVLGRLVIRTGTEVRSLCFASGRVRLAASPTCEDKRT